MLLHADQIYLFKHCIILFGISSIYNAIDFDPDGITNLGK
jgi:hypothetical protein